LEEEGPLEDKRLGGKTKCRKMPPHCSVPKTRARRARLRDDWRKKTGRVMARDGPKSHRKQNNKPCCT